MRISEFAALGAKFPFVFVARLAKYEILMIDTIVAGGGRFITISLARGMSGIREALRAMMYAIHDLWLLG